MLSFTNLLRNRGLIHPRIMAGRKRSGDRSDDAIKDSKRACLSVGRAIEDARESIVLHTYDLTPLQQGSLLKRYKRFLGDVAFAGDKETTIHVPNTGPMTGLLDNLPCRVLCSVSCSATRKYPHTLEWIQPEVDGAWVGVHSAKANAMVKRALQNQQITALLPYDDIKCEVKYGSENSRVDFVLSSGEELCYAEVKSVTLAQDYERGKIALFPDTVSVRAQRHVRELMKIAKKPNHSAALVFLIQRADCVAFAPCYEKDPEYATLVKDASLAGVKIVAIACALDEVEKRVVLKGELPVNLEYMYR